MQCFKNKCQQYFTNIKTYRSHLRKDHGMQENDFFKCTFDNCRTSFTSMNNFSRHLKKVHLLNGETQAVDNENIFEENNPAISDQFIDNTTQATDINEIQDEFTDDGDLSEELKLEHTMKKKFLEFLISLHQEPNLSKKIVQKIFYSIKTDILDPLLISLNVSDEVCKQLNSAYKSLSSFYKFQKVLKSDHSTINPQKIIVSQKNELVYKNGTPMLQTVTESISSLSMSAQISSFLSLPRIFETILKNIEEIGKSSGIQNFIQGKIWRNILENFKQDDIVIPLLLYYDEFEPDNPLSSNAGNNKICGFYFSIPVIPQYLLSSPEYIFVSQICLSKIKEDDLDLCLEPIVHELHLMESDGIILNINGEEKRIYVVLGAIIGDNLAINEVLGYQKSFNSNVFCRTCFAPKSLTIKDVRERENFMRTEENYEHHLLENDPRTSGIKCKSAFSTLNYSVKPL